MSSLAKEKILSFDGLIQAIRGSFKRFPDCRTGQNISYSIEDAALSAFGVFFMQSPSFLEHQKRLAEVQGRSNAHTLFAVHNIPCDNQIRHLLDPVSPEYLSPVFWEIVDGLKACNYLDKMRYLNGTLLVPFDGVAYFSSKKTR